MKIGDRVKIRGKNHAFENHTGVIIGDEYWGYDFQVKVDENDSNWIPFYAVELEVIE